MDRTESLECRRVSGRMLTSAFAALICFSGPAIAQTDAEIFDLIDLLRPTASAIVVDGDLSDWGSIPFYSDTVGDAGGDTTREITSVAVAPLDQELLLAVVTAGPPATGASFSVLADLLGEAFPDILLNLDPTLNVFSLAVLDRSFNVIASGNVTGVEMGVAAQSIEIRIPYASLIPILPASYSDALSSVNHRSWIRARVDSQNGATIVDYSTFVGSYRLLTTPFALDPPLQSVGMDNPLFAPLPMKFPMDGQWLLGQGPDGGFSHVGRWAYDWAQVDSEFWTSDPPFSPNNSDYYAFGAPVFAPRSGTVTAAFGGSPDQPPGVTGVTNNHVLINDGSSWTTRLLHFVQNTVSVATSQAVAMGDPVGLVGNSGFSTQAHLHLDVLGPGGTRRVVFADVDVSLNVGPNDPWRRTRSTWEPRSGFLVELPEPGFGLSILLGSTGIVLLRRRLSRAPRAVRSPTCKGMRRR